MILQSILNIHLPQAPSEAETRAIIHVKYISVDKAGKTTILPAKENKVQLRTDAGGRVEINLTHLTRQWMKYPMENLGVVIKVQIENNNVKELDIGQVGTSEVGHLHSIVYGFLALKGGFNLRLQSAHSSVPILRLVIADVSYVSGSVFANKHPRWSLEVEGQEDHKPSLLRGV